MLRCALRPSDSATTANSPATSQTGVLILEQPRVSRGPTFAYGTDTDAQQPSSATIVKVSAMSRQIALPYVWTVVLPAAVATLVDRSATWRGTVRIPIRSQAHVAEVLLVVDMVVASEEGWLATTGLQHVTSVADQTTTPVIARHRQWSVTHAESW